MAIIDDVIQISISTIKNNSIKINVMGSGKGGMEKWFQVELAWGILQEYRKLVPSGKITEYMVDRERPVENEYVDLYIKKNSEECYIELKVDNDSEVNMGELFEADINKLMELRVNGAAILISKRNWDLPGGTVKFDIPGYDYYIFGCTV